jgi:acylphosphatase
VKIIPKDVLGFYAEIEGIVQGVGFRFSVYHLAKKLDINGWVKNTEKGNVIIYAEGGKNNIEELISWLHKGPPGAQVKALRVDKVEFSGKYESFEILH